jgi:pyruvate kinase
MMAKIAATVESQKKSLIDSLPVYEQREQLMTRNHIAKSAVACAASLPVRAIITSTKTGETARICSSYRGKKPILALSENTSTIRQLSLSYGVYTSRIAVPATTDELIRVCLQKLLDKGLIAPDDLVVFMGGGQIYQHRTNFMLIDTPALLLSRNPI